MKKFLAIAAASAAAFGLGSIANAAVVDCANGTQFRYRYVSLSILRF